MSYREFLSVLRQPGERRPQMAFRIPTALLGGADRVQKGLSQFVTGGRRLDRGVNLIHGAGPAARPESRQRPPEAAFPRL